MNTEHHTAVFKNLGLYYVAASGRGDQYDTFKTKKDALLAARAAQIAAKADPNFILDLTNVEPSELGEYTR